MAFSTGGGKGPMADINVTPLVDVMLVLLIIFMITAPIMTHKIKIDLPQPNPNVVPPTNPPEPVHLKIDQSGAFYWNDTPVDEQQLKTQIAVIATKSEADQPEVQIDAADQVSYQVVARVLADAKSYGLNKIGFTDSSGQ
ncbi:ExbD/TolR family protein [Dyella nitratireducens]|uniref:Biopolymer transport protein exbD2 n=1 Tax=Dyella nitratireducens TaxID=1849580 RepID=A0ABQ1FVY4_9GAMM|nr:biopolymer transporter ExbD [Dyella nitratireducens]GGA30766.1 biopolymer transport protein exbD2 [Dyella nitratireducens]GLQ42961.1 biopolymer transport protein exbD2 [Dyella nitratireducens]